MRQAILKAADQIQKHPDLFEFCALGVPENDCDSPGCALGWISFYSNVEWGKKGCPLNNALGVSNDLEFYDRIRDSDPDLNWHHNADICAALLRKYADKYHPAIEMPEAVRKLFDTEFEVA